ncbi:hypothetical protein EE612_033260, partial [Oryza sativa]
MRSLQQLCAGCITLYPCQVASGINIKKIRSWRIPNVHSSVIFAVWLDATGRLPRRAGAGSAAAGLRVQRQQERRPPLLPRERRRVVVQAVVPRHRERRDHQQRPRHAPQ